MDTTPLKPSTTDGTRPEDHVCPNCGRCPTCGFTGTRTPWYPNTYPPYYCPRPIWPHPTPGDFPPYLPTWPVYGTGYVFTTSTTNPSPETT